MADNKVIINGETVIDLTEDTVTEDTVFEGETFHDASGARRVGRAAGGTSDYETLENKPSINGVELSGNKSTAQLGIPVVEVVNNLTTQSSTKALSAQQGYELNSKKYTKPNTGIPLSDLSQAVQTSIAEVGQITNKLSEYEKDGFFFSKNLANSEVELGNIISGANTSDSSSVRTKDYVSVKPSTNYIFSINSTANRVVVNFYDANKNWINADNNTTGRLCPNGTFTTPSNAEYVRYRCYQSDVSLFQTGKAQLEEGSTVTSYVVANKSNAQITEELSDLSAKPINVTYSGFSTCNAICYQMGKLVVFTFYGTTNGTTIIFNGLPKAKKSSWTFLGCETFENKAIYIEEGATTINRSSVTSGKRYWTNMYYIAE